MTSLAVEFVTSYTPSSKAKIAFAWNGRHAADLDDAIMAFRTVVGAPMMVYRRQAQYVILALALAASCGVRAAEAETAEQWAMQLFLGVCVPSNGDVPRIETAVKRIKLVEMASKEARTFLDNRPGRVWSTRETGGRFTVLATQPQTCTVVVKQIDPADLKRAFERWLPPASTGYSVKQGPEDRQEGVATSSYAILLEGRLRYSWVLRIAPDQPGATGTLSVRAAVP